MNAMTVTNMALTEAVINNDLFNRWTAYLDASAKTVETYTRNIRHFSDWLAENNISNPSREDIIAYRDWLNRTKKPRTVQGYLNAVKLFFQWTETENIYPNVAAHVKGEKIDREHEKGYLTSSQANRLLNSIDRSTLKGKRDYAMLSVMLTTGIREISIVLANIEDINTAGDDVALYYQGKGRDGKTAYVKLAEPVEAAVNEYLASRKETNAAEPLFVSVSNNNGKGRMTTRSVSRIIKDRLKSIGLDSDRLTGHSLRHTAAVLNMLNGGTPEETQMLLGHSNISTTMIYLHTIDRINNQSEHRIAAAIFS